MSDLYEWIDTAGGPFLLVAERYLSSWRGTEGWSAETHGDDDSDYTRASGVKDWIEKIGCGVGEAYVFGGDVGPISWITTEDLEGGYFIQWLGVDDESHILPALQSYEFQTLLDGGEAEHTLIKVDEPGVLKVIQAADIGDDLVAPSLSVQLRAGTYRATSVYLETSTLMIVVRKLTLQ